MREEGANVECLLDEYLPAINSRSGTEKFRSSLSSSIAGSIRLLHAKPAPIEVDGKETEGALKAILSQRQHTRAFSKVK